MSTNDPGTTNPDPTQRAGPDPEPASAPTRAKVVRQIDPDTGQLTSTFTTKLFCTAGLDQAREILRNEVTYLVNLSMVHLWNAYPLEPGVLDSVKAHLLDLCFITKAGKWNRKKIKEESFLTRGTGGSEANTFMLFSQLFNLVLAWLKDTGHKIAVKTMVHAGSVGPEPTRVSTHRPNAFLHMAAGTSSTPGKFR